MMLWEDGKFMLDDPIAKWLPSYANKQVLDPLTGRRTPARPVTVRHVLSHTSGLSLTATAATNPLTDAAPDRSPERLALQLDGARRLQPGDLDGESIEQAQPAAAPA